MINTVSTSLLYLTIAMSLMVGTPNHLFSQTTPRQQPGAEVSFYAPDQHDLYDGRWILSGSKLHMVGTLNDPPGWDHMDNDASDVHPVDGSVEIDVNEIENTGSFVARMEIPEGTLIIEIDRFHEFSECQDGGIVASLFEHGTDSGCGDANWPKTFIFLAGWGFGRATLNGDTLYEEYQIHFMITQGIRDRETLVAHYPLEDKQSPAGAVNPATQQLDFYIRSPEPNEQNHPGREVFDHFFAMEVTWH